MLYQDYTKVEGGWRSIARDRIWPSLSQRMDKMLYANRSIRQVYDATCRSAYDTLGFEEAVTILSYVGIGNGAGWATSWEKKPAVLLGLENIAELGWEQPDSIQKLLAHELGHLFMRSIRANCVALSNEPLSVLYEEGFAQHSEHVTLGHETWGCASQPGWLDWCLANEGLLAAKYLQALHDREKWCKFFGSWLEIDGWRQTGYFLGCRFVQHLSRQMALADIARLEAKAIEVAAHTYLNSIAIVD